MKITEDLAFKKQLLERIATKEFKERTGIHCSDLIYCLNKQALRKSHPIESTENEILTFSLGWSTQRWLTGAVEDAPEHEVDGIKVTPDVDVGCPWELKATFQSSDKSIEENLSWLRQIMAQCYVLSVTTAYLTRLCLMGNWRSIFGKKEEKQLPENSKPTLHAYRLEFTKEELATNWAWLQERKEKFAKILSTGELLPKTTALAGKESEFECLRCNYRGKECAC